MHAFTRRFALSLAVAAARAGCSKSETPATAASGTPAAAADKVMVVATNAAFAPFESLSSSGEVEGFDADVIKAYVELGLGVGIIASMAVDPKRDAHLPVVAGEPLFGYHTARIAVRRGHYLRSYAYRFIELCADVLDEATVKQALSPVTQE